jgi:tricorn protease
MDLPSEQVKQINITIGSDNIYSRTEWTDASDNMESSSISPDGKRMVAVARGDVYTLPAETGITRNLTQSSAAHDRNAIWSP